MNRSLTAICLCAVISSACGGSQAPPPPDVRVLLRTSRYDEAVAEAQRLVNEERTLQTLTVLATALAAQATVTGTSAEQATATLNEAISMSTRGGVAGAFAEEVAGSMAFDGTSFPSASSVLTSFAQPLATEGDAADSIRGADALLTLAAYGGEHQAPAGSLSPLVSLAISLLENGTNDLVFPDNDLHSAWECFRSAGNIAGSAGGQVGGLAAELAIRIAEANPQLAIAIACDLSSPRDRLREVLRQAHDADGLGRLSTVLDAAEGCSIGTYAP